MGRHDIIKAPSQLVQAIGSLHLVFHGDTEQMRTTLAREALVGADHRFDAGGQLEVLVGDSYQASVTPYTRDDLVSAIAKVLYRKRSKLKLRELFSSTSDVTPGSISWRAYRVGYRGKPTRLGQGGNSNNITAVTLDSEYEDFPVEYYAIAMEMNVQEQYASQNSAARINVRAEKEKGRRESMDRFLDRQGWSGVEGGTRGIFENPWVSLCTPSQVFKIGGDPTAMRTALLSIITTPSALNNAESTEVPTLLAWSPQIDAACAGTFFPDAPHYSVKQSILDSTSIEEIVSVAALNGIGEDGEHGIAAITPENVSLKPVLEPTLVPEQRHGLNNVSYTVAAWGGVELLESYSHALGLVTYEDSYA